MREGTKGLQCMSSYHATNGRVIHEIGGNAQRGIENWGVGGLSILRTKKD